MKEKDKKINKEQLKIKGKKIIRITSYSFIFLTLFVSLFLYAHYIYFHNRFYLQTRVGDIYIGGTTFAEAKDLINQSISNFQNKSIDVEINKQKSTIYISDFNATIDCEEILELIYNRQHPSYENSFYEYIYSIKNNFIKQNEKLTVDLNETLFSEVIYQNFNNVKPLKEPEIIFQNENFIVTEGQSGSKITNESFSDVQEAFSYLYSDSYHLEIETNNPKLSYGEIAVIADSANEILNKDLTFKIGELQITENIGNHPEWILFDISQKTYANAIFSKPVYFKFGTGMVAGEENDPVKYSILLNAQEIEKFVNNEVVNQIENHAESITIDLNSSGEITVDGYLKDGYAVEKEEAVNLIVENFKNGIYETELPITVQEGQIFDNTGLNLGINELIGYGESDFGYSNASRENNIIVGLSRFQNVLIAPGEVFNYADYIGPIDAAHGFLPGWVIKNKTQNVLEYGGGICQTSTTLFRAAFYGGFPILERHPHSYDVSYYRWPQPGLDASVYIPSASLKFKNDSPGYILIQQDVNTTTKRARVWIYGTDDGRNVEVTGPDIYGKYWASTTYEVPSENLAPGERVLSHGAVAGFQTDYWRTVTYADGHQENYNVHSSYAAVPATYLVGVGE